MPKLNQGWARIFWVQANFCKMLCYKYVDRNLQKIAFEMEGRQTFVDFYFMLNKIELYKKLPTEY